MKPVTAGLSFSRPAYGGSIAAPEVRMEKATGAGVQLLLAEHVDAAYEMSAPTLVGVYALLSDTTFPAVFHVSVYAHVVLGVGTIEVPNLTLQMIPMDRAGEVVAKEASPVLVRDMALRRSITAYGARLFYLTAARRFVSPSPAPTACGSSTIEN